MNDELIVAVYDTAEHAALAARVLRVAGVPPSAICQHTSNRHLPALTTAARPRHGTRFWARLVGGEPKSERDPTDRGLAGGSKAAAVSFSGRHVAKVIDILGRHNPIDIDEHAASRGRTLDAQAVLNEAAIDRLEKVREVIRGEDVAVKRDRHLHDNRTFSARQRAGRPTVFENPPPLKPPQAGQSLQRPESVNPYPGKLQ